MGYYEEVSKQMFSVQYIAVYNYRLLYSVHVILCAKVIMQEKLFQRYTHLLYCSVLSLGGNVNTRRMSQPDMGSIFHIKNQ